MEFINYANNKINLMIISFSAIAILTDAAKLPTYIKPCAMSDPKLNDCALAAAINALPFVLKGDKKFQISSLSPLKLDEVIINVGESLQMKFNNLTISGIDTGVLKNVRINPDKKEWHFQLDAKYITMLLTYDIKGRILLLPIVGSGPGNLTLDNPVFKYKLNYDIVTRKETNFLHITDATLTYKCTRMSVQLANLFNGDERLGNVMNTFLNENWFEVHKEIGPSIEDTMNSVVTSILSNYLDRIPVKYLFI